MLIALGTPQAGGGQTFERATVSPVGHQRENHELSPEDAFWSWVLQGQVGTIANQVRIEQRVILRITPQPGRQRRGFLAELPQQALPTRLVERPFGKCIEAEDVLGMADRGDRLWMYMRNRQIISAQLEEMCSPRDFYLGFYVERNSDGKLCVERDRLMSRAGAKCRISSFSRLVAVSTDP